MPSKPYYTLGLDIGQALDPTALALIEYDSTRKTERGYRVRALHRFPLRTPYTDLPAAIGRRLADAPLRGRTQLGIDATSVGRPVTELIRKHLARAARVHAITITGGASVTSVTGGANVPKRDLIHTTALLLEQQRLRIAPGPETDALIDELLAFRTTISDTGHERYDAPHGGHDDLVLALSLALWTAEHWAPPGPYPFASLPTGRIPLASEIAARNGRVAGSPDYFGGGYL